MSPDAVLRRCIRLLAVSASIAACGSSSDEPPSLPGPSPARGVIAFTRNDEGRLDLYTVAASGGTPHRLTRTHGGPNGGGAAQPAWSLDGSRVAFVLEHTDGNAHARHSLWTARADGRGRRRLVGPTGATLADPAWSADGATGRVHPRGAEQAPEALRFHRASGSCRLGALLAVSVQDPHRTKTPATRRTVSASRS